MKAAHLYFTAILIASSALAAGCGNPDEPDEKESDGPGSSDSNNADAGDVDAGDIYDGPVAILTGCDATKTCNALVDPTECIANFELGTTQAGYLGKFANIGFYGYNDKTPGATMIPAPNNYDSEPAVKVKGCDEYNDWALHMSGNGFTVWGAGIGMDWGGPLNPDCDATGALDCLEIGYADPNFLIADAEKDPRCQTNGVVDPQKMRCVIHGKNYKQVRDLSDYSGIGFWVLRTDEASANQVQVNFGIPETTRFLADPNLAEVYRLDGVIYESGCSDDVGLDSQKCFDDFAAIFRFSNNDLNKWVYQEILFKDLAPAGWGLDLAQNLGLTAFPTNRSVGIKFQVTQNQYFDFYLDDIHLIK